MDKNIQYNIPVSDKNIDIAKKIIERYFYDIIKRYNEKSISPLFYSDILIVLSEALIFYPDNKLEEIGYNFCYVIKQDIEKLGIHNYIGMLSGLGKAAFGVNLYSEKLGILRNFSTQLNTLLLERNIEKVRAIAKNQTFLRFSDYDVICGFSGVIYYLLDFSWNKSQEEGIQHIVKRFLSNVFINLWNILPDLEAPPFGPIIYLYPSLS